MDDVVERLGTDVAAGLDEDEAAGRLAEHGPNELRTSQAPSRLRILGEQFTDVLVWLLLVAVAISGVVLGEWLEAGVILAIVILNALIGYVQEARAEDALAALRDMAAPEAIVIRGAVERHITTADIVPGDLILLEAGNRVPADARLVEAVRLQADESALTGESLPVGKSLDPADEDAGVGDRTAMVFAGTSVAVGRGRAVVVATGTETEVGRIAEMLSADEPETPLTRELDRVGKRIAVLVLIVAAVMFVMGIARDIPAESMFLVAVALAVAAIPEGLPAVVTITLSRGVARMARNRAIVRRLQAVETLGSASVICSDKTGTLTRNEMRVQQVSFAGFETTPADVPHPNADARTARFAEIAVLCNDARATRDGYEGDPTEVALLRVADPVLLQAEAARAAMPRIDELGFDSSRKRMTTVHRRSEANAATGRRHLVATKGAPEVVIERATKLLTAEGEASLEEERRRAALAVARDYAESGLRTLALAYRTVDEVPDTPGELERDLVLVAIVGMSDELRPETRPAVDAARRAGIRVVMVTGDHAVTARAIADDLALLDGREVMTGAELRDIDADELSPQVGSIAVYARVDPADKVKIVKAWQANDAIVAMTGDGVNDAPALMAADIGVAMGTGTDVAKESADMVLTDDNFATIIGAVQEGRTIFSNLKKVVYFLLSANLSEVVVMLLGFLFFAGLGEPLLATQLLWVNLVTDGLPAIGLGVDPPVPGLMDRPPDRRRDILGPSHQLRLVWQGALIGLGALGAYVWGHEVRGEEWEYVRTLALTTLVLGQLLHAFNVRAQGTTVWRVGFTNNPLLLWGMLGSVVLHLMVVYTPLGNQLFDTSPILASDWPAVAVLAVVPFLLIDRIKAWILSSHPEAPAALD